MAATLAVCAEDPTTNAPRAPCFPPATPLGHLTRFATGFPVAGEEVGPGDQEDGQGGADGEPPASWPLVWFGGCAALRWLLQLCVHACTPAAAHDCRCSPPTLACPCTLRLPACLSAGRGQGDGQEPGAQPPRRQQALPAQVAAAGGVAADSSEWGALLCVLGRGAGSGAAGALNLLWLLPLAAARTPCSSLVHLLHAS